MTKIMNQPTNNELRKVIIDLFSYIKDINNCHGCATNCYDSKRILRDMNHIADSIDYKDRWWSEYVE